MDEIPEKQRVMHYKVLNSIEEAIKKGMYFEAIHCEYAAIEGRLEVMMGILGYPCNQYADDEDRRKVNISQRRKCLCACYKRTALVEKSKLPASFFEDKKRKKDTHLNLDDWICKRNTLVHGLCKNALAFEDRALEAKNAAEDGYQICLKLYSEVNRLRTKTMKAILIRQLPAKCINKCKLNADPKQQIKLKDEFNSLYSEVIKSDICNEAYRIELQNRFYDYIADLTNLIIDDDSVYTEDLKQLVREINDKLFKNSIIGE